MRILTICIALFLTINSFAASYLSETHPFQSQKNADRFEKITSETRCIVCQNQNLMDSRAPLANDLREKIYQLIQQGKSDQAIQQYLTKRYGQFILLRPGMSSTTLPLWAFPLLAMFFAFSVPIYFFFMNRQSRT